MLTERQAEKILVGAALLEHIGNLYRFTGHDDCLLYFECISTGHTISLTYEEMLSEGTIQF